MKQLLTLSSTVFASALMLACASPQPLREPDGRPVLRAGRGTTPVLDGEIGRVEYADATAFAGVRDWTQSFLPVADAADLALRGWVKHDGENLYFAFEVVDDVLYGIDTPRWLPEKNPHAHELSRRGWPWFGDEIELLINARREPSYPDKKNCAGDGSSWQMVCNLTKSRLGGIGKGGLLEGEPRSDPKAWETYRRWIEEGAMEAAAKVAPGGKGYVIEWKIRPNPCLEVRPGEYWSPAMGEVRMGLNIALGDLDEPERSAVDHVPFRHESWWSGGPQTRTWLNQWGTLVLTP
jgi:SSS family solute:Na+ symporter